MSYFFNYYIIIMKLDFKILWIDDERKDSSTRVNLERIKNVVKEKLETNYFRPEIKEEIGDVDLDNFPYNSEEYDLFLIDFTIWEKNWSDCIEKIRSDWLYTDIIFYSQDDIESKVKDYMNEKDEKWEWKRFLEWVFLSRRDELSTKFWDILDIIDRKVNNLYSMRGLVLAETADIDYILCEIIDKLFTKHWIEKNNTNLAKKDSTGNSRNFTDQHSLKYDNSKGRSFLERLNKKWWNDIFVAYLTDNNSPLFQYINSDTNLKNQVLNYRNFYKDKRNPLAHNKTGIDQNWNMNAWNISYSIEDMKNMRKELLKFKTFFEEFKNDL